MGISILDVIENGNWQRALFTTYALSLSFFEAMLLRSLRRIGCQEVWIITDIQGYRDSLIERRSQGVGQEFRLVPVALRQGVFHPKCIYLVGPEQDALVVGSGNLTFGGFGRNLEVLEVITSRKSPAVFSDFAGFLTAVENRNGKDLQCPDSSWIQIFRDCALRASASGQSDGAQPTLIHTVDSSVVDQLPQKLGGQPMQEMTVMSPFFDPDGSAVRKLADALGCTKVRIAIPRNAQATNFPVSIARKWGYSIEPVWVDSLTQKRTLHAKWIEARGVNTSAVLSGSINATTAALCSTRNVEVGLLRCNSQATQWAAWKPSLFPAVFEPTEYEFASPRDLLVHAHLDGSGELSGVILASQIPSGLWQGKLIKPSGDMKAFEVHAKPDGRFRVGLPEAAEFSLTSGLQISLHHDSTVARGWVHVEDILRMPRLPRLNIPAMLRLISREDTEDDEIALLEYLAVNATKHLPTFARRVIHAVQQSGTGSSQGGATVAVALADLAPTPTPQVTPGSGVSNIYLEQFTLDRVFAQLRKRLLGHGELEHTFRAVAVGKQREIDTDDEGNLTENVKRFENALFGFTHEMRKLIDSSIIDSNDIRALYVIWFEVVMNMLLARRGDLDETRQFMREWAARVAHSVKASDDIDALEQHFITCSVITGALGAADEVTTELHDWLEIYYGGEVDARRAQTALLPPIGIPYGILASNMPNPDSALTNSLSAILASPTIRQYVLRVVEDSKQRKATDPSFPIFRGDAGKAVLSLLQSGNRVPRFKEQWDKRLICANCFMAFPKVMEHQLEENRIALCSCGWVTIRTKR